MERQAELIQLGWEAVAALEAGPPPNWAEIAAVIVSGVVGVAQLGVISWGLWRWGKDIAKRGVVLDEQAARRAEISQALARQTEALGEQLRASKAGR